METVDEEITSAAINWMEKQVKGNKPFFLWYNSTAMHFRTHLAAKNRGKSGQDDYSDRMVTHDEQIGQMLDKVDQLGIAVKSLAAAKSIYETLGLSVSPEEIVEQEHVRLVMVPVGESRLELLEATSEDSAIARFIAKRGEGLHHVCLRVPDLPAAVARLKKDGVRLVSEEIKAGAGGHKYVFVHPSSAGGVLLELVEG